MAHHKRSAWHSLRARARSKAGINLLIPDDVLPPKLRTGTPSNGHAVGRRSLGQVGTFGPTLGAMDRWHTGRIQATRAPQGNAPTPGNAGGEEQTQMHTPLPPQGAAGAPVRNHPRDELLAARSRARDALAARTLLLAQARMEKGAAELERLTKSAFPSRAAKYSLVMRTHPASGTAAKELAVARKEIARFREPELRFLVGKIDFWRPYCPHFNVSAGANCVDMGLWSVFTVREDTNNAVLLHVLAREMGIGRTHVTDLGGTFSSCGVDNDYDLENVLCGIRDMGGDEKIQHTCTSDKGEIDNYVLSALDTAVREQLISVQWELAHYPGSHLTNPAGALSNFHGALSYDVLGRSTFTSTLAKTCEWRKNCSDRIAGLQKFTDENCCRLRAWISLTRRAFSSNNVKVAADLAGVGSPYSYYTPVDVAPAPSLPPNDSIGTGLLSAELNTLLGKVFAVVDFADFSGSPQNCLPSTFLDKRIDSPLMSATLRGVLAADSAASANFLKQWRLPSALIQPRDGEVRKQKLFSIDGILSSPLFTVSMGYSGGQALQPACMAVQLRPYQLETLKWMEDQESRRSISDPFWVKLSMARINHGEYASKSEPFWLCPLTGCVSKIAPPAVQGGILAEEMGLGKTVEVIALIVNSLARARTRSVSGPGLVGVVPRHVGTTLIVTPVSLLKQWELELRRRTKSECGLRIYVWYGQGRTLDADTLGTFDVILTTYTTLSSRSTDGVLQNLNFFRVIIDESTYVKGGPQSTVLYNALMRVPSQRRWAVSGTPFANNITSLEPVLRFLGVTPWGNRQVFGALASSFNDRLKDSQRCNKTSRLPSFPIPALAFMLKSLLMRHIKSQRFLGKPLIELPRSTGRIISVMLPPAERIAYDNIDRTAKEQATCYVIDEDTAKKSIIVLQSLLIPVRMAAGGVVRHGPEYVSLADGKTKPVYTSVANESAAKLLHLVRDIELYRSRDATSKFVIFTEFDPLKQTVIKVLRANGVGVVALDGSMSALQRGKILKEFEDNLNQVALVLSNKSAHGLTLTCANIVVLLEPSLSQEIERQACDRVHRIGQTRQVTILTYIAKGTIDERIAELRRMRGQAPAIGEHAPPSGYESLSHITVYRQLFGHPPRPD
jgi:hypothetical protein